MPSKKYYQGKYYSDISSALSGDPPHSRWAKWFGGVICPLLPLWGSINCWVTQKGFIPGSRGSRFELEGVQAIVLGFFLLGFALFCHFHFFWGNSQKLWRYMELGKIISGILAVGCIFYFFWFMYTELFG